jgi:hypothetical protein
MYAAKQRGKGHYACYTPDLTTGKTAQGSPVAQLRETVDEGQLLLDGV